jgi:signal transduction histidine kinase
MVGHDLRNPLTGIAGATYYIKSKLQSTTGKTREMLNLIDNQIKHSNKIINDLLDYSKEMKLEISETTPKTLAKEVLSTIQIPKTIQVINLTKNSPRIEIDLDKMTRVFTNIIKNAIDAMPEGGKLTLRSKTSRNFLEITFTDSGIGIPDNVMRRIWTPLFTTKAKGMGLGLPICKRIVEVHEGEIFVKSTVGKGTILYIILPTQHKPEGGEEIWVNAPESSLLTMRKA